MSQSTSMPAASRSDPGSAELWAGCPLTQEGHELTARKRKRASRRCISAPRPRRPTAAGSLSATSDLTTGLSGLLPAPQQRDSARLCSAVWQQGPQRTPVTAEAPLVALQFWLFEVSAAQKAFTLRASSSESAHYSTRITELHLNKHLLLHPNKQMCTSWMGAQAGQNGAHQTVCYAPPPVRHRCTSLAPPRGRCQYLQQHAVGSATPMPRHSVLGSACARAAAGASQSAALRLACA